jgi:2-dehydropantoate 2-reductase
MRYVIYGAGAIGGVIGGRLHDAGHEVVLIARGDHLQALRQRGLELRSPDDTQTLAVPAAADPQEAKITSDDVVVLAMKGQDTAGALDRLVEVVDDVAIVCAQNGVENERAALRRFPRTYAMTVMLPATHLEPGVVEVNSSPVAGILDLGRYPGGTDELSERIAADLDASGFSSRPDPRVMRSKYAKLLMNLANALEAACGRDARGSDLHERARAEAGACLAAAGIDYASREEDLARRGDLLRLRLVGGKKREGGSSWQSLARGSGRIEADYLNGEIVLLGRIHGIPTPVNALLQQVANEMARDRRPPGSVTTDELVARLP